MTRRNLLRSALAAFALSTGLARTALAVPEPVWKEYVPHYFISVNGDGWQFL